MDIQEKESLIYNAEDAEQDEPSEEEGADEEKVKLVVFTLNHKHYSFYGRDVNEILPVSEISYVPGAPEYILGIINVRGDIESVVDIHKFLGFPEVDIKSNSRIIIGEKNGIRSGILIDSVQDVMDVALSQIHPPLSTLDADIKEFVVGETTYKKEMNIILDIGKLFEKMIAS